MSLVELRPIDTDPEQRLYQAVLIQAFKDATVSIPTTYREHTYLKVARAQARDWLLKDIKDFETVCNFAGVDPRMARRSAEKLAYLGWPSRTVNLQQPERARHPHSNAVGPQWHKQG